MVEGDDDDDPDDDCQDQIWLNSEAITLIHRSTFLWYSTLGLFATLAQCGRFET